MELQAEKQFISLFHVSNAHFYKTIQARRQVRYYLSNPVLTFFFFLQWNLSFSRHNLICRNIIYKTDKSETILVAAGEGAGSVSSSVLKICLNV